MTCFIARNLLSEFADSALEPSRTSELQEHLAGCDACSRELDEIRNVRAMLRGLPVHRAPADFLSKVQAKVERKSLLDRAGAVLAPLLRLPRPAQAGLAFAASLVIAVTVFWSGEKPGLYDLEASPRGARLQEPVTEVASAPAAAPPAGESLAFADAELDEDAGLSAGETAVDDVARNAQLAKAAATPAEKPQAEAPRRERAVAQGTPPPSRSSIADERVGGLAGKGRSAEPLTGAKDKEDRSALARKSVSSTRVSDGSGSESGASPSGSLAGASTAGSGASGGGGTARRYSPPTQPGLYASTPAPTAPTPARRPNVVPVPDDGIVAGRDADAQSEPAYDSADAFGSVEPESVSASGDWGSSSGSSSGTDPEPALQEAATEESKSFKAKKEARSDAPAAGAAAPSVATALETTAEGPAADNAPASAEPPVEVAAAAAPAKRVPTITGKFRSASSTAPAEVVAAAKAVGGRIVSPTPGAPPALGKSGASTVVIVEVPASGIAAFEEKLRAAGTLEIPGTPSGTARYRLEVVRQ